MVNRDNFRVEYIPELDRQQPGARRAEFFRHHNQKHLHHQVENLEMLRDVQATRLTEVGSYLGFATALFMAAGFRARAIDVGPVETPGEIRPEKHISKNILDVSVDDFADHEILVCCEILEHLYEDESRRIVQVLWDSGATWLLARVPYRCASMDLRWTKSRFSAFFSWTLKLPTKAHKTFEPQGPKEHKWELGYKGYPLEFFTSMIEQVGYRITATDDVPSVQSVMMLCRNDQAVQSRI